MSSLCSTMIRTKTIDASPRGRNQPMNATLTRRTRAPTVISSAAISASAVVSMHPPDRHEIAASPTAHHPRGMSSRSSDDLWGGSSGGGNHLREVMAWLTWRSTIGPAGHETASLGRTDVAIVLALLGVPVWLVVGMLLGGLYTRRRYRRAPGVFRCKIRMLSGSPGDDPSPGWGRAPAYGRWVHDVLVVSRGLALVRFAALPVAAVTSGPRKGDPTGVKGLGPALPWCRCALMTDQ